MSILNRLFGSSGSQLTKQARNLLPSVQVFAASSYSTVASDFQCIRVVDLPRWDFILTIGGIFCGISQLAYENLPEPTKNFLLEIITEAVVAWQRDAPAAVEDCRRFVDRTHDDLAALPEYKTKPEFLFLDALGSWVVWNLFGHTPSTAEERQLVRVMGGMLVHSFMHWWKEA